MSVSQLVQIYHNPQCAKSREALAYIKERGLEPQVIEYLKTPPSVEELRELVKKLCIAPSSMIRAKEFHRLGLQPPADAARWLELIAKHPEILERPIVVAGERARIGRPVERLNELFS